jgi:DNA integrity scanning protein DisA with diadenylate cyclase activity
MIILKLGSGQREVKMIVGELGGQMDKEQLLNMYEYATDTKFCPLIVNMDESDRYKRFRKGFLEILNPDEFLE